MATNPFQFQPGFSWNFTPAQMIQQDEGPARRSAGYYQDEDGNIRWNDPHSGNEWSDTQAPSPWDLPTSGNAVATPEEMQGYLDYLKGTWGKSDKWVGLPDNWQNLTLDQAMQGGVLPFQSGGQFDQSRQTVNPYINDDPAWKSLLTKGLPAFLGAGAMLGGIPGIPGLFGGAAEGAAGVAGVDPFLGAPDLLSYAGGPASDVLGAGAAAAAGNFAPVVEATINPVNSSEWLSDAAFRAATTGASELAQTGSGSEAANFAPVRDAAINTVDPSEWMSDSAFNAAGAASGAASAGNFLSRILGGNAGAGDWADLVGKIGPSLLGYLGASKQSDSQQNLYNDWLSLGKEYRDSLSALNKDPMSYYSSPQVQGALQQGSDILARSLSAKVGNPILNPTALQEMQNFTTRGLMDMYNNRFGQLTTAGQLGLGAASGMGQGAVNAQAGPYNAIGAGIQSVFGQDPYTQLAEAMRRAGITTRA